MPESLWKRQTEWAGMLAWEYQLHDLAYRREALEFARGIMRDARRNIETLLDRLSASGYRFAHPDGAYVPPKDCPEDLFADLEEKGVFVPISLQAWLQEVGCVNLMGSHPAWVGCGYLFPDVPKPNPVWCTDPLVVEVLPEFLHEELAEWQWRRGEIGESSVGPFRIGIAPDDIHKANLSGGSPYELPANRLALDPVLLNERHCYSFVAYLRCCFAWGGFPGFELIDDRPETFLEQMRADLIRF